MNVKTPEESMLGGYMKKDGTWIKGYCRITDKERKGGKERLTTAPKATTGMDRNAGSQ